VPGDVEFVAKADEAFLERGVGLDTGGADLLAEVGSICHQTFPEAL